MKILNYKLIVLTVVVVAVVLTGVFFIDRPQDDSIERISLQAVLASGDTIEFTWADNNDDTKYYRLHHGVNSGQYGETIETIDDSNAILVNIVSFGLVNHYFAVSAVDYSGNESTKSTELIINLDPDTDICGNGIVEPSEDETCDSDTRLCVGIGNYQGEEMCNSTCDDWSGICIPLEYCGDGIVNGDEDCEGSATNVVCTNGIYYGTAGCNSCQLSGCNIGAQACGNSILEGGEQCRDNAQYTKDCLWNNVYVGSRACDNASCLWYADCVKNEVCQDGYKDAGEVCDMNDFGTTSIACSEWGNYSSGLVECTSSCTANLSNCSLCGNGVIEGDETCDGSNYINNKDDCSDWGFNFGDLNCNNCQIDYSDCQTTSS